MKRIIISTIVVFAFLQSNGQTNSYKTNSKNILFNVNGYSYTEEHFIKELRFVEFILDKKLSAIERQEGLREIENNFKTNPLAVLQEIEQVDAQMQQMYQITDVAMIGRMRSALISQIYAGAQSLQGQELPFLIKLMYKYVPVIAFDSQNMLAFTFKDFEAYIYLMQFQAQMLGQNLQFTQQELLQAQTDIVQQFNYMSLEQKQYLCSMQVQYEYIYNVYNSLTPQQKQQWQSQIINQQASLYQNYSSADDAFERGYQQAQQDRTYDVKWPDGVNTKAEKQAYLRQKQNDINTNNATMGIYYDTMMQNSTMWDNIIEDWGDTGNYWTYKGVEY